MIHSVPGLLILIAGVIGCATPRIDVRAAWALIAVAGLLLVL